MKTLQKIVLDLASPVAVDMVEEHVHLLLQAAITWADEVLVFVSSSTAVIVSRFQPQDCISVVTRESTSRFDIYAEASRRSALKHDSDILFMDCNIFGPLSDTTDLLTARGRAGADVFTAFSCHTKRDRGFESQRDKTDVIFNTSWLQVGAAVARSDTFKAILTEAADVRLRQTEFETDAFFTIAIVSAGFAMASHDAAVPTISSIPYLFEADRLIRAGHPLLHSFVWRAEPLIHEMQTLRGKTVIDAITETTSFNIDTLWRVILAQSELREMAVRFEELRLIDSSAPSLAITAISQKPMRCALVAHVYYLDFLSEVIDVFARMPEGSILLVSVASQKAKSQAEERIAAVGIDSSIVKCVAFNRGRDMSSLFITFRDEFLSDRFDLVLRLHSKKTPQVAPHISDYFRSHLVDNLIPDKGYVKQVVNLFQAEPTIGMAIPPTIHIGFATLGHAWFANREGMDRIVKRLNLKVALDKDTPIAAYGTMFWFRPKALAPMFAEEWQWDEFNAEPNHVDGGLAHIMERLMGYVAQNEKFRVMQIVSKDHLIVNYTKLEYKMQLLASCFPTGDIRQQVRLAKMTFKSNNVLGGAYWARWTALRTRIKRNHPEAWRILRPVLKVLRSIYIEGPRFIRSMLRKT